MTDDEIDARISELKNELAFLREEKTKLARAKILEKFHLVPNKYYVIRGLSTMTGYRHACVYFKYTPENFSIVDGSGTIGYDGTSFVKLNYCIEMLHSLTYSSRNIVYGKTFDIQELSNSDVQLTEVSDEVMKEEKEDIEIELSKI